MSIKDNFPSVGPSLSLNFARSKILDPRITFSRPSTSGDATYMNGNGLIVTAAADEPRFDHKYENGVVKSLGLLVEEQRTNILQQSVATTSNWTGGTSNTTFSNLSLNALGIFPGVEVTSTTGEAWHRRTTGFNIPFVSGTEYAVTFYYREGTSGYARLQFRYNSQESYVQGPADGSSWSILQNIGSITDVTTTLMDGQSTYKTTYSFTPNFTGDADMGIGLGIASAGTTVIALGGQVEAGGFPTSYIPTSGSTKTRTADNVTMTGTNFSDWYNQEQGTMVWVGNVYSKELSPVQPFRINRADGGNLRGMGIQFDTRSANNTVTFVSRTQSSNIPGKAGPTGVIPSDNKIKIAGGYIESVGLSTLRAAFNGLPAASYSGSSQTDVVDGAMNELEIMGLYGISGSNIQFTGVCEQLVYYPKIFTDTQLQNLTK